MPVTSPQQAVRTGELKLPDERSLVVNRLCRVEYQKAINWVVLRFLKEEGKPAEIERYALPNQRLAEMESLVAKDPNTVFLISGECTKYRGRPYLIVRLAPAQPHPAANPTPILPTSTKPAPPTATKPTTTTGPDSDDEVRRLLEGLLNERPGKPVLQPPESAADVKPAPSISPAVARQLPQAYGMIVADRTVFFDEDADSGWCTVRFIGDNTLQEQPVRLLPCQLVLVARELSKTKLGRSVRLHISGELTRYKGHEYLLLRKVVRERQLGEF